MLALLGLLRFRWTEATGRAGSPRWHSPVTTPGIAAFRSLNDDVRVPMTSPQIRSIRCEGGEAEVWSMEGGEAEG